MLRFVFSPNWFFGIDSVFEFLALGITALISLYCYRCYYKVCQGENYKLFSYSFFAIVASFFFKILTNITILYEQIDQTTKGNLMFTITSIQKSEILFLVGSVLHYFFFLFGLLTLFLIIYKQKERHTIALITFLLMIITFFSSAAYFVFYLTSSVLLFLIFFKYWKNFKMKKTKNSLLLALSFGALLLSHLTFIFVFLNLQLYVVAETLQLFGFILLLLTFMRVIK